ncbi:programmed cell death protein 2-like isoform X1 [Canna indica]|uniref:Programmed cell death protein 2-like isoform X1 n=1 Tax=Canna indica TaxID=4628 RepID=A0AAQ3JX70_9LILI|nr:programmed cell death protein 2-like isoform X1 [Canna indica]
MGEILLGLPGPWAEDYREKADYYTTKIGGLPDWPIAEIDITSELLHCRVCGGRLCLVAQVYAPISSPNLNLEERALYILGCPIPDCGINPQSWRALRLQKCHGQTEPDLTSPGPSGEECVPVPKVDSLLQNALSADESGNVDDGSDSDAEMEDLARALSEAFALASSSKKQNGCRKKDVFARGPIKRRVEDTHVPVLPCFYIYSQKLQPSGDMDTVCSGYSSLSHKENHSAKPDTEDEEKWEGETYEYDRALGADRTYLKFKKQMDAYPEQCLRYSFGGNPLLATNNLSEPDNCKHCGSSRAYEMQLMSPLLYFLHQAADGSSACSTDGWSWITLIVYTCSKSCCLVKDKLGSCCWEVSEEAIIIQDD